MVLRLLVYVPFASCLPAAIAGFCCLGPSQISFIPVGQLRFSSNTIFHCVSMCKVAIGVSAIGVSAIGVLVYCRTGSFFLVLGFPCRRGQEIRN